MGKGRAKIDQFDTPSAAYRKTLQTIINDYDYIVAPRGCKCRELVNYSFSVQKPSSEPISIGANRDVTIKRYTIAEKELYLSGELQASVWAERASKFWLKIANPNGTINSNYGWLVFQNRSLPANTTPWEWARRSLETDGESRQAYIRFSLPAHQWIGNKDQVCTMHMNFLIRDGLLQATTVMRSNDVWRGLPYDLPWFCYLQERMGYELQIDLGQYVHFVHSLHLYERDLKKAEVTLGESYDN